MPLPPSALRPRGATCATPQAVIPVFPGTNCEYDTARAFEQAGGDAADLVVLNNLTADRCRRELRSRWQERHPRAARSSSCRAASPAATSRTAPASSSRPSSATPQVTEARPRPARPARRPDARASATASRRSSSWAWCPTARSVDHHGRRPDPDLQHHRPPPVARWCAPALPATRVPVAVRVQRQR